MHTRLRFDLLEDREPPASLVGWAGTVLSNATTSGTPVDSGGNPLPGGTGGTSTGSTTGTPTPPPPPVRPSI